MADIHVSSIHIYPVKSLQGISLSHATVEARGLRHDRRWMVVGEDGVFLTQRECSRMACVSVMPASDGLDLSAEGMPPLRVPFHPSTPDRVTVRVWRSVCEAQRVGGAADLWLTEFLGRPCRLVFMPDQTQRFVNPDYAVHEGGDVVSFADGYPLHLIAQASLEDLNARLEQPLPMDRFRPNLVISGATAFADDGWKRVRIGECVFYTVKSCDRCAMTTIHQQTGERGTEPLSTLAGYRRRDGKVFFGRYLIPEGGGEVQVGDAVEVLEKALPAS